MSRAIGLHTICYAPDMVAKVEAPFRPYDVSANPEPERREMAHMLAFWRQGRHKGYRVSGLFSPKFASKSGLTGQRFVDFIEHNPGYDVWFVNPFPALSYFSFNVWEQGEYWHPGLCDRASRLFAAAGLDVNVADFPRTDKDTVLFCNFWAGTPAFWDRFMAQVAKLDAAVDEDVGLFDTTRHDAPTNFYPFVFERLFTTFLTQNRDIRACPWSYGVADMKDRCWTETTWRLLSAWAPMVERWDAEAVYDERRRKLFRTIARLVNHPDMT